MKHWVLFGVGFLLLVSGFTIYAIISRTQMNQESKTSWGKLEWFELELCPFEFRLAVIPKQPVLFAYKPTGTDKNLTYLMPTDEHKEVFDSIIQSLDVLIRKNRIMENKPHEPEKTFDSEAKKEPSLHLRIGYGTDGYGSSKRWQSSYSINEIPPSIQVLLDGCRELGIKAVTSLASHEMSKTQAMEALLVARDKDKLVQPPNGQVAKLKITTTGDIYLNHKKVSFEELSLALTHLKKING
jgi:hypothetical protein